MTNAVVLCSGGIDSATALALAIRDCVDGEIHLLTINYGQKHAKEIDAAQKLYAYYKHMGRGSVVHHEVLDMPNIFAGSDSTLIDHTKAQPEMTYDEILASKGPSPTVVPFRNANLLSIATTYAIINGCGLVYAAMHATDANNWAYPDCTPEFVGAMAGAMYVGSYFDVRLMTPFLYMEKIDVIKLGHELGVPFELTWSCYEGREAQCGTCPTCVERIEGFKRLGIQDPVQYEVPVLWPLTSLV